jgi:dTDP-4-dehydrorhamnose 3,5-epimerase
VIFTETALAGAWIVDLERRTDDRGFFARAFCESEFASRGVNAPIRQANLSFSRSVGTLRGLHFQYPPAAEGKLVRCVGGAIFDVIVDLRPESPTFLRHVSVELSSDNRTALFVPPRFAHGYVTLTDDAELLYLHSELHSPVDEGGLVHDDADLRIVWPRPVAVISERDRSWPLLYEQRASLEQKMRGDWELRVHNAQ